MGLGEDKGIVPRFCDNMFACIRSKEKEQVNVRTLAQVCVDNNFFVVAIRRHLSQKM